MSLHSTTSARGRAGAAHAHGTLTRRSPNRSHRRPWGLTLKAAPTGDQVVLTPRAWPQPVGPRTAAAAPRPYSLRAHRIPASSSILPGPGSAPLRKRAPHVSKAAAHAAARDARVDLWAGWDLSARRLLLARASPGRLLSSRSSGAPSSVWRKKRPGFAFPLTALLGRQERSLFRHRTFTGARIGCENSR